jgi:hypothetical protein
MQMCRHLADDRASTRRHPRDVDFRGPEVLEPTGIFPGFGGPKCCQYRPTRPGEWNGLITVGDDLKEPE